MVFVAGVAVAADRLTDPTQAFVEDYDPSGNDFLANVPERTVLLRIRADFVITTGSTTSPCQTARRGAMPAASGCCSEANAMGATSTGGPSSSLPAPCLYARSAVVRRSWRSTC